MGGAFAAGGVVGGGGQGTEQLGMRPRCDPLVCSHLCLLEHDHMG